MYRLACVEISAIITYQYSFCPVLPCSVLSCPVLLGVSRDAEEAAIAIISQLVIRLHDCSESSVSQRLLCKLTEHGAEKLERCAELCAKYAKALLVAEKQIESTAEALKVHQDPCILV